MGIMIGLEVNPDEYTLIVAHYSDGKSATVTYLTFGRARINIGQRGLLFYDDGW